MFFWIFYSSKNHEQNNKLSTKTLSSTTVSLAPNQYIRMNSEWLCDIKTKIMA